MNNQAMEQEDETKSLWRYVSKLRKSPIGGGNNMIKCRLCDFSFNGSYTRVRAHLLQIKGEGVRSCPKVSLSKLFELKKLDNQATLKIKMSKKRNVPLPPVSDEGNQTNKDLKRLKGPLESCFNIQARDTLDYEIARMLYSSGLLFNLARSLYYMSVFSYAANTSNLSGYVPPTYNKLRGPLHAKRENSCRKPFGTYKKFIWKHKGVTIVSDGWSDPQKRPLINFMTVTDSGSMFLKSINTSDEIKTKILLLDT